MLSSRFFLCLAVLAFALALAGCPASNEAVECGPPIAAAGDDIQAEVGQVVVLRGTFRLPPDELENCQRQLDTIEFFWEQTSGPEATLDGTDSKEASFVPASAGDYGFRCRAIFPNAKTPEKRESQWDAVQVTVVDRTCGPPVADAGEDQLLSAVAGTGVLVSLDGSRSRVATNCPEGSLSSANWTVVSQPAGSDVQITPGASLGLASFQALEFGEYQLSLVVQDSEGTDGRVDTDTDEVLIEVVERPGCEAALEVNVVSAQDGAPISGAKVRVIDAAGASHDATAGGDGVAEFTGLAPGARRSISAWVEQNVPALPDSGDNGVRPRFQGVSVLEHCNARITLALPLTDSGRAALPRGRVVAKIPQAIFDQLPQSQKYAGACTSDGDCDPGYLCRDTPLGDRQCSPRSLLPVFSLGDPNISGQLRGVMLMPVFPLENFGRFPVQDLLAPPLTTDAFLPGNMASDDSFLNGLGPSLGLNVWGSNCTSTSDCPNTTDWLCDDNAGQRQCKDQAPLRSIHLFAPAGTSVPIVLTAGVVDVSMVNLLPVLMAFVSSGSEGLQFDVGAMLGAFKVRVLHTCLLRVNVPADGEVDISAQLATLDLDSCWSVTYQQQEVVEPIPDPYAIRADNTCTTDADCGWPDVTKKCLPVDPAQPTTRYCFIPMFRVRLFSDDAVETQPVFAPVNPIDPHFDTRLRQGLPTTGSREKLCAGPGGVPQSCDPVVSCEVNVPASTECAFPYGMALASVDLPAGHPDLAAGGRVVIGFNFNITPNEIDRTPSFLVPPASVLGEATVSGAQLNFRNVFMMPEGTYRLMPGQLSTSTQSRPGTGALALPGLLPLAGSPLPDPGLEASVTFVPRDPLAECSSTDFSRVHAALRRTRPPNAGSHPQPTVVGVSGLPSDALVGVALVRLDRVLDAEQVETAVRDDQWIVYAPAGTTQVELPTAIPAFPGGAEIWVEPFGGRFSSQFDYDLFPAEMLSRRMALSASDDIATVAP